MDQLAPEPAGVENRQGGSFGYCEQILITSHQDIGPPGGSRSQNPTVVRVSNGYIRRLGEFGDDFLGTQQGDDVGNRARGQLEAPMEHIAQFLEHDFTRHELVLCEDDPHHIGTEPARGKGRDKDVRVQENPHETSRAMSSSVR